jgi:hypothetical protein
MQHLTSSHYAKILAKRQFLNQSTFIADHLTGFEKDLTNKIFNALSETGNKYKIYTQYIIDKNLQQKYQDLCINFSPDNQDLINLKHFNTYYIHPPINYNNFICSFNGSDHVSRKLLVAILERFGYFTTNYCSKNFVFTRDKLDGHITDYVGDQDNFYRKFFIADDSDVFFDKINSFGHVRYDHKQNIYNLEHKLTQSFLHIVSETMATSYYPFVTEKFLYSVVTRGLFLAYAQPGWHEHLEKYYGFKRYTNLFDYEFDSIQNPVERLVELMTMISKFSVLSSADWKDLYQLESDTIEYNYHHYFSQDYLKCLTKYS